MIQTTFAQPLKSGDEWTGGHAAAYTQGPHFEAGFCFIAEHSPAMRRHLNLQLDEDGRITDTQALQRASEGRLVVIVGLAGG